MQFNTGFNLAGIALLILLSFTSCLNGNSPAAQTDSLSKPAQTDSAPSDSVRQSANTARMSNDIRFVITKKEDDANPTSAIELYANGKTNPVSTISGYADLISIADYKSKEIPVNALAACGGWWAGAGDYFYVIESGNKLVLYQGWQDEGQTDEGYHWKKIKEFDR